MPHPDANQQSTLSPSANLGSETQEQQQQQQQKEKVEQVSSDSTTVDLDLGPPEDYREHTDDDVDPNVLAAMEEGKEEGTIVETDTPFEPTDDSDSSQSESSSTEETSEPTEKSPADDLQVPEATSEDLDLEGLSDDDQEWTWGQKKETVSFTYKGMKVIMSEPENEDDIINGIRGHAQEGEEDEDEPSQLDRLKVYAQIAIDSPEITDERWNHGMTPTEKFTVGSVAAQYLNAEDFTAAPEGGQNLQQDS